MEKASVTISTKSWHYKLIKAVLGEAAPTPQNMHNLCPYFWLFIFSLLTCWVVVPFKYIGKAVIKVFSWLDILIENSLIYNMANHWFNNLAYYDLYKYWDYRDHYDTINTKYAKQLNLSGKYDTQGLVKKYYEKETGSKATDKDGNNTSEFKKWLEKIKNEYHTRVKANEAKSDIAWQKKRQFERKMENFRENIGDKVESIGDTISSWKNIIKWTKRATGAIITVIGLVLTYFIVNLLSNVILTFVDWCLVNVTWVNTLFVLQILGLVLAFIGVIILFIIGINAWKKYIDKKGALTLWYIKYPYYLVYGILYFPLKVVFYYFIWQIILVNLYYGIIGAAKMIGRGFVNFFGIFGQYFGASFGDYCPGLTWEEENKK